MAVDTIPQHPDTRYLRAIDLLHLSYNLLLFVLILIFRDNVRNWHSYLLIHAGIFVGLWTFLKSTRTVQGGLLKLLRDWYTPIIFIFYYEETEPLNHLVVGAYLDPFFVHLEQWVFGFQPSLSFHKAFPWPWFSELMHMGYFFYYFAIPVLGFALWFNRKRYIDYQRYLFTYGLTMFFCYVYFILFPSAGPKFHIPEAISTRFPGYIITLVCTFVVDHGAVANGAFPSSHVAMSTAILLCAFEMHRKLFFLYLPFVILLYLATVYLQAHYAIDVLAGLVVGTVFYLIADNVRDVMERRLPFLLPITWSLLPLIQEKPHTPESAAP